MAIRFFILWRKEKKWKHILQCLGLIGAMKKREMYKDWWAVCMLETAASIPKGFFKIHFLIWGKLLYNVVLVSAIQQCKSDIIMHILPPFPPSRSSQSARLGSLCYIARDYCLMRWLVSKDLNKMRELVLHTHWGFLAEGKAV